MISDLSPGDKLSLKGKLFELSKKLNILDIQNDLDNQAKERHTFEPKILDYDIPERDSTGNVYQNINRAEVIRKQKQQLLEESVRRQEVEGCTFSPAIYTSKSRHNQQNRVNSTNAADNRPAYERLYAKGKEYQANLEQKRIQVKNHDFDGERLFAPKIITNRSVPAVDNMQAPEFLYQDAKHKEERVRLRELAYKEEARLTASQTKMNSSSSTLLKRKAEREVRAVFSFLNKSAQGELLYEDIVWGCEIIAKRTAAVAAGKSAGGIKRAGAGPGSGGGTLAGNTPGSAVKSKATAAAWADGLSVEATEQAYQVAETVWSSLDHFQVGRVSFALVLAICQPLLFHTTVGAAMGEIAKNRRQSSFYYESQQQQREDGNENEMEVSFAHFKEGNLAIVKSFFLDMLKCTEERHAKELEHARKQLPFQSKRQGGGEERESNVFRAPQHSHKLAARKEKRDLERIAELKAQGIAIVGVHDHDDQILPHMKNDGAGRGGADDNQSLASGVSGVTAYNKVLSIREALSVQRKQELVAQVRNEELDGCSFTPTISKYAHKKRQQEMERIQQQAEAAEAPPPPPPPPPTAAAAAASSQQQQQQQQQKNNGEEDCYSSTNDVHEYNENDDLFASSFASNKGPLSTSALGGACADRAEVVPSSEVEVALSKTVADAVLSHVYNGSASGRGVINSSNSSNSNRGTQRPTGLIIDRQQQYFLTPGSGGGGGGVDSIGTYGDGNRDIDDESVASSRRSAPSTPSIPVYDRLYAMRDNSKLHDSNTKLFAEQLAAELEPCTFSPTLPSTRLHRQNKQTASAVPVNQAVGGFDKNVQRLRGVAEKKQKEKEEAARSHIVENEKYLKSREVAKQGFKPFSFTLAERRKREELAAMQKKKEPKMIMDIKLSNTKSAKIQVHEGADPTELARDFGRIYSLDEAAQVTLANVIEQSMIANGICMLNGGNADSAAAPDGDDESAITGGDDGESHGDSAQEDGRHHRHHRRRHRDSRLSHHDHQLSDDEDEDSNGSSGSYTNTNSSDEDRDDYDEGEEEEDDDYYEGEEEDDDYDEFDEQEDCDDDHQSGSNVSGGDDDSRPNSPNRRPTSNGHIYSSDSINDTTTSSSGAPAAAAAAVGAQSDVTGGVDRRGGSPRGRSGKGHRVVRRTAPQTMRPFLNRAGSVRGSVYVEPIIKAQPTSTYVNKLFA